MRCAYDRDSIVEKRLAGAVTFDVEPEEPAHSAERRIVELYLLHIYIKRAGPSIPFDQESSHELWVEAIPRMALKSKALLYSMFAIATLYQMKHKDEDDSDSPGLFDGCSMEDEHEIYARLAFRCHRMELSQVSPENIDIIFTTANTMRLMAFVNLSERSLEPYCPPIEWLRMVKSHCQLYSMAWRLVKNDPSTQTARLARTTPIVWQPHLPIRSNEISRLNHILYAGHKGTTIDADDDSPDEWDTKTWEAYSLTLKYICDALQSIQRQESFGSIARNLMLFPVVIPDQFISLVDSCKPRALVILAHYFALLALLQRFWYIGDTGAREVEALARFLPQRWQNLMVWPLHIIKIRNNIL